MSKKGPSKLVMGIALLLVGFVFLSRSREINTKSADSFRNEPISIEGFSQNSSVQNTSFPKRIIIPSLGIDLEVSGSKIVDGYWEVYDDKAGWGEGSGVPGKSGNQVIFAHAREGLFLPLRSIEVGTEIYILTDTAWYKYFTKDVKEVSPYETEVIEPTEDETLTLYTCSGYKDSKRLIVTAKPN